MVTKIYGHNHDGSFQSGKGEHVRLWTVHEIRATGVLATRADLLADGLVTSATLSATNSITFQGVEYTVDATYDDALWSQMNLSSIMAAFEPFGNIVDVSVTAAVNTGTSPTSDFASVFLAGADNFGTEISVDGDVWQLDIRFEQKGLFHNAGGETGFVKGEPSIGLAVDNYGSSIADIHVLLEELDLITTTDDNVNVDNTVDTNTTGRPDNAPNAIGDPVQMVSAGSADEATSQSVVIETFTAPDLQS